MAEPVAILARVLHVNYQGTNHEKPAAYWLERPKLPVCYKHPRAVVYDGKVCPACAAEHEFMKQTEDMKGG